MYDYMSKHCGPGGLWLREEMGHDRVNQFLWPKHVYVNQTQRAQAHTCMNAHSKLAAVHIKSCTLHLQNHVLEMKLYKLHTTNAHHD